jgi:thiamine-phosphate pyrophosphorylase
MYSKIHYITQDHPSKSHSDLCLEACKAGVKWVQIRMKHVTENEYLSESIKCREITRKFDSKFIVNDNIEVAIASQADGIHLGQDDLSVSQAREMMGNGQYIGGTANTFDQIIAHVASGVNYVGVGPFRFTETKQQLSPIIGLAGYQDMMGKLNQAKITIPVIAIGGIELADVCSILDTGVHGIAVSGLVTNAQNKHILINNIYKKLNDATT